jgi:hypothetical protein
MLFDSYAMRALVFQRPVEPPLVLSSLMISDESTLHRFAAKVGAEEIILTISMQLSEGLVGQFRGSPRITPLWRLKSVSGESEWGGDPPTHPGLSVGPETVVQSQLEALRSEVDTCCNFRSPCTLFINSALLYVGWATSREPWPLHPR